MEYRDDSPEGRFLAGDGQVVGEVIRVVAGVLTLPRFWSLRPDWTDLHQEVLRRILESLRQGRFDPTREFLGYAHGVARFTALDALSRKSQESTIESGDAVELAAERGGGGDAEDRTMARQLARLALDKASPDCRRLFRDYFYKERTYRELSESMGVPVGTVKSRLFRCLASAQRAMGRRLQGGHA